MRRSKSGWSLSVMILASMGMLLFESAQVAAAPPKGVFKVAIHWNISGDWLDPATRCFAHVCPPSIVSLP